MTLDWGRELARDRAAAEDREWLCTNGIGGFASGTVAGTLTRRYHGLLVAALEPPLGRTLLVAKLDETARYRGARHPLFANRWADGTLEPRGYEELERFHLDGTTPVWLYAVGEARLEKRIWMEHGANTTYVRYRLRRASEPLTLQITALVDHRDYHGRTRGDGWSMRVEPIPRGVRVVAFDGARPLTLAADRGQAAAAHDWYRGFRLAGEEARGLDAHEDHLHAATFGAELRPGEALTLVLTAEPDHDLDGDAAWARRQAHDAGLLERWRAAHPVAREAPPWIDRLVLAADQFLVRRPSPGEPDGLSVIAGYHWFGDWGRDTMVSLPGLTIAAGRAELARRVLTTFARYVDQGMIPNRFPDAGETPEYNTVDAALWYLEAARAYVSATKDDATLAQLFPALEAIVHWYRRGTRYGIGEDPGDGLIRSGAPGLQLTWMDARVGDREVTPRTGKAVEINALWYNGLCAMRDLARRLGRPATPWDELAARVRASFGRFWNARAGCCFDVIDGPEGDDPSIRPNQVLAVSLPASPLGPERQAMVVEACARHLHTSLGLRTLSPGDPRYRPRYEGGVDDRDGAYHQGTVWAWLLGPFALAHLRVHRDPRAALALLEPVRHHLGDHGLGTIAEIFDGDAPHIPRGCIAQAWSVAETLRAWLEIRSAADSPA